MTDGPCRFGKRSLTEKPWFRSHSKQCSPASPPSQARRSSLGGTTPCVHLRSSITWALRHAPPSRGRPSTRQPAKLPRSPHRLCRLSSRTKSCPRLPLIIVLLLMELRLPQLVGQSHAPSNLLEPSQHIVHVYHPLRCLVRKFKYETSLSFCHVFVLFCFSLIFWLIRTVCFWTCFYESVLF